jgi:hypothetical protein
MARVDGGADPATPDAPALHGGERLPPARWFGRFEVADGGPGRWLLRDWLRPAPVRRRRDRFAGLAGDALARALFLHGWAPAAWGGYPRAVADRPRDDDDPMFWQFPCRTEGDAYARHAALEAPALRGDALHCYLGLPWATFIDRRQWPAVELQTARTRLFGLRAALAECGLRLRVHTVCQHVYWERALPHWHALGLTDLWLSHLPAEAGPETRPGVAAAERSGMQLHPWSLYAVNVEDPARRVGLRIGADPAARPLLASFIGTHMPHYLCDARLRLRALAAEPDIRIDVTTDRWHFEGVVYGHQVRREPLEAHYAVDDDVRRYNEWLSDSVFALCPAGAGPNTLRLWEALAVGAIPVLIGPAPALPRGGSLAPVDWDAIVLRCDADRLGELPARLRAVPLEERRRRQRLALEACDHVRRQRCF